MLDAPICRCDHVLPVHDPCSICECPKFVASGRRRKYPKRKTER